VDVLNLNLNHFLDKIEKNFPLLSVDTTLSEVLNLMKKFKNNFVIFINEEKKPVGILTERDVIKILSKNIPLDKKVYEFVKKEIIKIKYDTPLIYTFNLMIENFIRRIVVVDEEGKLLGVVTQDDLFKFLEEDIFKVEATIKNFLNGKTYFYFLEENAILEDAIKLMAEKNIGALPILDKEKKPVGIISERDILEISPSLENLKKSVLFFASKPVITVKDTDFVSTAIKLFKIYNIKHLVVVDKENRALNILSQRDFFYTSLKGYFEVLKIKLRYLKEFLGSLPEIVLEITEQEGKYIISWLNKKALEILGKEILKKEITTFIPLEEWNKLFIKLKRHQSVYKEEIKSQKGNFYEVTGYYLDVFSEKEAKIALFLRDITEEYEERQKIINELKFKKQILNNSLDLIFVIEPGEGKIIFANSTFLKTLGYSEEEIRKKTIFDIVNLPREKLKHNIEVLIRKEEPLEGERYYKDRWGNLIPVEIKARTISINNKTYILVNSRRIEKYVKVFEEARAYKSLFEYIHYLLLAQNEEEIFKVFEKYLLNLIEGFHYFEIDKETNKIKSSYKGGKKDLWEDCLEDDPRECKVFRTGNIFEKKHDSICIKSKVPENVYHMCIPIFTEGKIIGIISLISIKPCDALKKESLIKMVNLFNVFLNNIRLYNITKELSIKDSLTGLYNRRIIYEYLEKEIAKNRRSNTPFSIVLIDLDDFKKINDNYGHLVGDKVLREISLLLKTKVRGTDIVGRFGGEEFIIILPETSKKQAFLIAKRIKRNVSEHLIYLEHGKKISITASFGIAGCPKDAITLNGLLNIADKRLYKAKTLGKDFIVAV